MVLVEGAPLSPAVMVEKVLLSVVILMAFRVIVSKFLAEDGSTVETSGAVCLDISLKS